MKCNPKLCWVSPPDFGRLVIQLMIFVSSIFIIFWEAVADGQESPLVGRASCAASTCHGGAVDRGPAWNHALTKWLAQDPHAGAGLLLRDEDSRAIVTALEPQAADSKEIFDQVLRKRCISCHTTATASECKSDQRLTDALLARGVSCESCHGAARSWLAAHVQTDWQGSQRFQPQTGMLDTESVIGRADGCLRCHVGSRREDGLIRDMNHDLIAAGHPALRFDLLLYNENLPSHWDESGTVEQAFDESALRVRSVGRASSLSAAAALSGQRAADHQSDPGVPWPELSDYDCFACHQSLSISEYRLPASEKNRSPLRISDGLPIWNAWHTIGQKELSRKNLQALSPQRIGAKAMAAAASNVSSQYRQQAINHEKATFDPQSVIEQLRSVLQDSPPRDWHEAAIQYLSADAAVRDLKSKQSTLREQLEPLLRFNRDANENTLYQSPAKFDPNEFQKAMLDALTSRPPADVAVTSAAEVQTITDQP